MKYEEYNSEIWPEIVRMKNLWGVPSEKTEAHRPSENIDPKGENYVYFEYPATETPESIILKNTGTDGNSEKQSLRASQLGEGVADKIVELFKDTSFTKISLPSGHSSFDYSIMLEYTDELNAKDKTIIKIYDNYLTVQRDEMLPDIQAFSFGSLDFSSEIRGYITNGTEEKEEQEIKLITTDLRASSAEKRWDVDVDYAAMSNIELLTSEQWYKNLGNNVKVSIVSMFRIYNETDVYPEPMLKFSGSDGTKWFKMSSIEFSRPTGEVSKIKDDKTVYASFSGLEDFKNFVTVRKENGYEKIEMYLNFTDETKSKIKSIRFVTPSGEKTVDIDNFNYIGGEDSYEKWYK